MENKYPRKRKKDILDKIAEKLDLPRLLEYDDDSEFDRDINSYYKNMGYGKAFPDYSKDYKDEGLIDKLIMEELLNFEDLEHLIQRLLKEFKRTCSMPDKNIEIVFRDSSKNKNSYSKVHKKIGYRDSYRKPYDRENER